MVDRFFIVAYGLAVVWAGFMAFIAFSTKDPSPGVFFLFGAPAIIAVGLVSFIFRGRFI